MIGILKTLFDLCFYYSLSGYFLYLISEDYPSIWGVPILVISIFIYIVMKSRKPEVESPDGNIDPVTVICCLLPGLLMAFMPTTWQIAHYMPAWVYVGFTMWNGLIYTDRRTFKSHFGFTAKLYCTVILGVIGFHRVGDAVAGSIPYLILYLMVGVCLMRILREDGKLSKSRNVIVIIVVLISSIALVGLQAPQIVVGALGFFYRNVISWIILGFAMGLGAIVNFILNIIRSLFGSPNIEEQSVDIDVSGTAQDTFGEDLRTAPVEVPEWLQMAATVLLILAVAYVIFRIMRRLLGSRTRERKGALYAEEHEKLNKRDRSAKDRILRPKDPRQAVRWYYRKYLKEGSSRRGTKPFPADTSLNILQKFNPFFPKNEAGELRDLYIIARYQHSKAVPKAAVDAASDIWSRLKKS